MSEEEKVFTAEEVAKHDNVDDLWMVINGKVYDVTKNDFVQEHPGGSEILVDVAGQDATSEFADVGHSEDAEEILEGLYIGKADPETFKAKKSAPVSSSYSSGESESAGSSSFVYLIAAGFVAAGAYFYLQN